MRITRKTPQKSRVEKEYVSDSFKEGKFTKDELFQYKLTDDEIATILDYQALLPILQCNDNNQNIKN